MVKGATNMAKVSKLIQRMFIELYKTHGWTIKQIADQFGCKERTVIAIVEKREQTTKCLYCGKELEQTPGHRQKEFCSPKCYKKWRKEHALNTTSKHVCQWCGKEFIDPYHLNAKYCCQECRDNAYRNK